MKAIVCNDCGHIVLNTLLPSRCPVCKLSSFEEKEGAINQALDVNNLTDAEKKHTPLVKIVKDCGLFENCIDAHIRIGDILHPMTSEHYINNIDFYLDKEFVLRAELRADKINPGALIHIKNDSAKILTVIERCNLHGAWMSEIQL